MSNPAARSESEFGPEVLLVFVGYSSDGTGALKRLLAWSPELQRELDKLKRVKQDRSL